MALTKCSECNKEISDTVKKCPHCGYKLKRNNIVFSIKSMSKKKKMLLLSLICGIVTLIIVLFITFFFPKTHKVEVEKNKESIVKERIKTILTIRANYYNDKLSYSNSSISHLIEDEGNHFIASGYLFFDRLGSDKKWETTFECKCNYYEHSEDASCDCDLGESAYIVP